MPQTAPSRPEQLARRARAAMRKAADPRVARSQRMFFKPWEKIHLLGIKTPDLRSIERELYQSVRKSWSYSDAAVFCDLLMRDHSMESKALGLMLLARYHREFPANLLDYTVVKPAGKGRHLETVYETVSALLPDGHDLIHKAAGWLLREAGKAEAQRLETYLLAQGPRIPRTTVRYAIERFPEIKRRKILEKTRVPRDAADISNRRGKSQK